MRTWVHLLAWMVLLSCRQPSGGPEQAGRRGPTGAPQDGCVESCGSPERPCQLVRTRIPGSERPAHALHHAVDSAGILFVAWNAFVGSDPTRPTFESRIAAREPNGEWHVQRVPWPEVHGIAALPDGALVVHVDEDDDFGGGALFRLDDALAQLRRAGTELEWVPLGGAHDEKVPLLGSLEATPRGSVVSAFESPFALGELEGEVWRRFEVGDFYQLQSPHIAVDAEGTPHAFIAFPGRYDEPLWIAPPAAPEPAPVAGPFALEDSATGTRVHVLGLRCAGAAGVCFDGAQIAGWELVYAVRDDGAWRTPLVIPNFSSDPENACTDCTQVETDAREPVGIAGGCGGVRLFVERSWNRPACTSLPEGTEACDGTRLEIVSFDGDEAQTTFIEENLPPVRRFLPTPVGGFHTVGVSGDRSGIDHFELTPSLR